MKQAIYWTLLIWAIILIPLVAFGQQFGFDTLAGAQYPKVIRTIPNQYAVRGFAETFGDFYPTAKKELENGRQLLGVDLLWSDTHSFGDSDIPAIKRLSRKYETLCASYPGKLELSPFTEHNLRNPDKYLDIAQANAPHCTIVNTPWNGAYSKKYKNEIHGHHSVPPFGKFNYSFDGTNAVDSDVEGFKKKYAKAERFYFWTPRYNLRWSMNDTRTRAERLKDPALPTREYQASITYLTNSKGYTAIPSKWLVKSHAEKHGQGDLKGDKLLIISPHKSNAVILKKEGKIVASLPYYGTYQGGGYRFYWTDFGYKLGTGVNVFQNGTRYGVISPGFRDPTYRD